MSVGRRASRAGGSDARQPTRAACAPGPWSDIPIMTGLEGLLAILIVALMPVALVFISRYYALREKELSVRADGELRRLDRMAEEKRLLEARVEAIEAIVCTVEFDLDQRIHGLEPRPPTRRALQAAEPSADPRPGPEARRSGRHLDTV